MKTVNDPEIKDLVEEADEDLQDGARLTGRGAAMGLYQTEQAAEKFLMALAAAAGRPASPMWDIGRLFKVVEDLEGMADAADAVRMLADFATPPKAEGTRGRGADALHAARIVRRSVLVRLGLDLPPEPPLATAPVAGAAPADAPAAPAPAAAPVAEAEDVPDGPQPVVAGQPDVLGRNAPVPHVEFTVLPDRNPEYGGRPGRSDRTPPDGGRRDAYVKSVLVCASCGVRLPRTRQTAHGRVPCPHCGRPMTMQPA